MVKAPNSLAVIFSGLAALFGVWFWLQVSINEEAAWARFVILSESGATARALGHGNQTIALRQQQGVDEEQLAPLKYKVAKAEEKAGSPRRAIDLYRDVLMSEWKTTLSERELDGVKLSLARLELGEGNVQGAVPLLAEFLDKAGDEAAGYEKPSPDHPPSPHLAALVSAIDALSESLPIFPDKDILIGSQDEQLARTGDMVKLGGFYAKVEGGEHAAAGLLAAAHETRLALLGAADADTIHTILLLGPVYERLGHLQQAEKLYLEAVHAQEQAKGSNSPELSLYLRLLANVYLAQGRYTEAEALNVHIRRIFRDSYGGRRYLANQGRDRRMDVNRPVSIEFPLEKDYKASDLVAAGDYEIPLSKAKDSEEMSIRLGLEVSAEGQTMPKKLEQLIDLCAQQSGEHLSLRSGYRSFKTQSWLYENIDHRGKVTRPGTSEHQLGLAVDIDVDYRLMRNSDRAYQCFENHAWEYGFILSYPKGNNYLDGPDTYEPWHWRYVGLQTALLYREAGPLNKPQEFLAALPCYEERAQAGLWTTAGDEDICLSRQQKLTDSDIVLSPTPKWGDQDPVATSNGGGR